MSRRLSLASLAAGILLLAAGCGAPPPPTPGLVRVLPPTATAPASGAEVLAVVAAEAEAVRQQDIDALAALWLPDGQIVDAAHTPDDAGDNRRWEGWPAIQDRYVREVFPYYAEPDLSPRPRQSQPSLSLQGDEAEVVVPGVDGRTTQDRWRLRLVDGQWRIAQLEYNLAPQSPSSQGG